MRWIATLGLASALAGTAGCGDDTFSQGRADSGAAVPDAGISDPLPFQVGWRFKYRAQLNYRTSAAAGDSKDAIYELVETITSVDDRGALGESTLTITATGAQVFRQNWDPTAGVHSWVAAAGPANDNDQVSPAPTVVALARAPDEPPIAATKRLPLDDLFFLDLRRSEALKTAFFERYTSLGPRFIAPDDDPQGRWVLGLDGDDPSMEFYPAAARHRTLSLAYDPRGFLKEIRETLGNPQAPNTPNGSFTLTLLEGP
ncbi:MAG: hypothetical protein IT384_09050 [Deltaproteobacteria bacterium]|nr:hypothetical protein [Deltaproteobacteria bacterium]